VRLGRKPTLTGQSRTLTQNDVAKLSRTRPGRAGIGELRRQLERLGPGWGEVRDVLNQLAKRLRR
jgi:hypothetical protein